MQLPSLLVPCALRRLLRTAFAVLPLVAAGFSLPAAAQVPASSLQLRFVAPSGTALATDVIPVVLRLTNLDATHTFAVDAALPNLGLDPTMLPATGSGYDADTQMSYSAPFATYSNAFLVQAYGCSGSFTNGCDAGAYSFVFGDAPFSQPFTLAAGASFDFLLGNFVPVGGAAPAGSYAFYRGVMGLYVFGADADGRPLSNLDFPKQTCDFDNAGQCADVGYFTRDIVAVPEPASAALLALGLGAIGWQLRRRSSTRH